MALKDTSYASIGVARVYARHELGKNIVTIYKFLGSYVQLGNDEASGGNTLHVLYTPGDKYVSDIMSINSF